MEHDKEFFQVYKLDSHILLGQLLVIITIRNNPHYCRAEYFVLFPDELSSITKDDCSIEPIRLSFNKTGIDVVNPEGFIDDVEDYMIRRAKEMVLNQFKVQLYEIVKKEGIECENRHHIKLVKTSEDDILGLWMLGKCEKEIKEIRRQTNNKKLSEFLNNVVDAPIFKIEEIS